MHHWLGPRLGSFPRPRANVSWWTVINSDTLVVLWYFAQGCLWLLEPRLESSFQRLQESCSFEALPVCLPPYLDSSVIRQKSPRFSFLGDTHSSHQTLFSSVSFIFLGKESYKEKCFLLQISWKARKQESESGDEDSNHDSNGWLEQCSWRQVVSFSYSSLSPSFLPLSVSSFLPPFILVYSCPLSSLLKKKDTSTLFLIMKGDIEGQQDSLWTKAFCLWPRKPDGLSAISGTHIKLEWEALSQGNKTEGEKEEDADILPWPHIHAQTHTPCGTRI